MLIKFLKTYLVRVSTSLPVEQRVAFIIFYFFYIDFNFIIDFNNESLVNGAGENHYRGVACGQRERDFRDISKSLDEVQFYTRWSEPILRRPWLFSIYIGRENVVSSTIMFFVASASNVHRSPMKFLENCCTCNEYCIENKENLQESYNL